MNKLLLLTVSLVLLPAAASAAPPPPGISQESSLAAPQPAASHEQLGTRLIQKWQLLIQESKFADVNEWQTEMQAMISRADVPTLQAALERNIYQAMLKTLKGDPTSDEEASTQVAERAEALGLDTAQMKALGDANQDLVYVPIAICRIADTRIAGGVIAANSTRSFDVTSISSYAAQGGDASNCGGMGAAGSFAALAARLTVVTPASDGYLTAFAFGTTQPLAGSMIYRAGEISNDHVTVQLDQGAASNELSVYSFAQTHLVIDAVGYYRSPGTPTFDCQTTAESSAAVPAGGTDNVTAPTCPAGFTETSTNCMTNSWLMPLVFISGGTCSARNNSAVTATLRASRNCCRSRIN